MRAAFAHEGAARVLVHRLKYEGLRGAAGPLAAAMAGRLPHGALHLVPVPRVAARSWRYGIDPALELARSVAALTGLGVVRALRAPLWAPALAGRTTDGRHPPAFRLARPLPEGAVLVDDVLTTGATLGSAHLATGGRSAGAVAATGAVE